MRSTSRSRVWTSTSADTGILEGIAGAAENERVTGGASIHENPERFVPLAPVIRRFGEDVLDRGPVGGVGLAIRGGVRERDHATRAAEPVVVLDAIGEGLPVVAEVLRQLEALRQRTEELVLAADARQVGGMQLELRGGRGGGQCVGITAPHVNACKLRIVKVGQLHSRILLNVL